MKILFVDDEPNILLGLKRAFRGRREEWDMSFVTSGQEALEHLEKEPADVVVADMKMPGMDGATLLCKVKDRHPGAIRLILSGFAEKELVLRSIGAAHQYLCKPCEAELLGRTIDRAIALRTIFDAESLRSIVAGVESLPTLPAVFQQIVAELQKPDCSLQRVGEVIAQDIGMSARILQVVNSSFFGLRRPLSDIGQAAAYLGLDVVNALVLGSGVVSRYEGVKLGGITIEQVWQQSMRTVGVVRTLTDDPDVDSAVRDDARTAAILVDAGRLVLAAEMPDRYAEVCATVRDNAVTLCDAERSVLGATHAQVGAYVIGNWGLPDSVVEAVAFHEEPGDCPVDRPGPLTFVHVASRLAAQQSGGNEAENPIDVDYLTRIGVADRLESWREQAEALIAAEV